MHQRKPDAIIEKGETMQITYRMPQSVLHFSIKDVISVDIISGEFSEHMEHAHKAAWELVFVTKGSADVLIGNNWHNVQRERYVFIHPKILHDIRLIGSDSEAFICSFIPNGDYPVKYDTILHGTEHEKHIVSLMIRELHVGANNRPSADGCFDFVNEEKTVEVHQMLCSYLEQLSIRSSHAYSETGSESEYCEGLRVKDYDYVVDQVNNYIVKHISEGVKVSVLAKKLHYNRSWLYRVYKETTGEDIMTVITSSRINEAKKLLDGTKLSIKEIAARSGFQSLSYFSKHFKAVTGVNPARYRAMSLHRQDDQA